MGHVIASEMSEHFDCIGGSWYDRQCSHFAENGLPSCAKCCSAIFAQPLSELVGNLTIAPDTRCLKRSVQAYLLLPPGSRSAQDQALVHLLQAAGKNSFKCDKNGVVVGYCTECQQPNEIMVTKREKPLMRSYAMPVLELGRIRNAVSPGATTARAEQSRSRLAVTQHTPTY
jgi:hypothetical protein